MAQVKQTGKIAVIQAQGYYRGYTNVIACFDDEASAKAYCKRGGVEAIKMPESWESVFQVGERIYSDQVRREYQIV